MFTASMSKDVCKVDALPGAQRRPAVGDRQAQAAAQQAALDVRRQIVAAFEGVPVVRLVLAHRAVEPGLEVAAHRGVGVLVEGQRGGGVLDEHMHQPDPDLADGRTVGEDLVGDQMKAAAAGFELEAVLVPHGPVPRYLRNKDYFLQLSLGKKGIATICGGVVDEEDVNDFRMGKSHSACPPLIKVVSEMVYATIRFV